MIQAKAIRYFAVSTLVLAIANTHVHSATFPFNPIYPKSQITKGKGRFGESRGSGDARPHQGVDIDAVENTPLYAVADSTVVGSVNTGNGGGIGTVLKPDGMDVVAVYWHQSAIAKNALGVGKKVKAGELIGYSGNTTVPQLNQSGINSSMAYHLHFGIGVPNQSKSAAQWLKNKPSNGASVIYQKTLGQKALTPKYGDKTYYWTNPAPYLPLDNLYRVSGYPNDPLIPFIGDSMRSQYNALTGANLPLGKGAVSGARSKELPKLVIANDGVPSDIATEMNQNKIAEVVASGKGDELLGRGTITADEYAYYAAPRTIFNGDSAVSIDIGDGDISKIELINKIGSSRFGNHEWQSQLLGLSMRGMLIEYLNGINAENFIKKETLLQRERIESLYAAWTTLMAKLNVGGDLQNILERVQTGIEIPEVSRITVEELFEKIDLDEQVSSADVASAITLATDGEFKHCSTAYVSHFNSLDQRTKKEMIALAFRLGFHPIDLLNVIAVESSFGRAGNIYAGAYKEKKSDGRVVTRYPAGGYIQLTSGGAGDIPYMKIMELFPESKSVIQNNLGTNASQIKARAQDMAHGPYLKQFKSIDPRLEFAVYDAYFYSKNRNFVNTPPSQKNIAKAYRMVIGAGYVEGDKRTGRGYAQNSKYDLNDDGRFTPEEAVQHPMFTQRRCPYVTDEQLLSNAYGLTDADLKLRAWDSSIARLTSPTLKNLGGQFALAQTFKAKSK